MLGRLKIIKETEKMDSEGDSDGHPTASYTHEQMKGTGPTYHDGAVFLSKGISSRDAEEKHLLSSWHDRPQDA